MGTGERRGIGGGGGIGEWIVMKSGDWRGMLALEAIGGAD